MENNKSLLYIMQLCNFKRTEEGDWEVGLLFNEGEGIILDKFGNKPEEIWDYRDCGSYFSIPLDTILKQQEKNLEYLNGRG